MISIKTKGKNHSNLHISFVARTCTSTGTPSKTETVGSPVYVTNLSVSTERWEISWKTNKNSKVPYYALDYNYEVGKTSMDEDGLSTPIEEKTSSGFNECVA